MDDLLRILDVHLKATSLHNKDEKTKVAILLKHVEEKAQKRFQTFRLSEDDEYKPLRNDDESFYKSPTRK